MTTSILKLCALVKRIQSAPIESFLENLHRENLIAQALLLADTIEREMEKRENDYVDYFRRVNNVRSDSSNQSEPDKH